MSQIPRRSERHCISDQIIRKPRRKRSLDKSQSCTIWSKPSVVKNFVLRLIRTLGCLATLRSSSSPCANWHFDAYRQDPFSSQLRHNSVLYKPSFLLFALGPVFCPLVVPAAAAIPSIPTPCATPG